MAWNNIKNGVFSSFLGGHKNKTLNDCRQIVIKINDLENDYSKLSDSDLRDQTLRLRERLSKGETLDQILPDAFAIVREASKRLSGERHYDVQLIGGILLHRGMIAEMRTGEGKTLVATLPAYLNALSQKGVHIVTVNDYLARRDAVWMGQIYHSLGLTVGIINHDQSYIYDPSHTSNEEDKERDVQGSFKVMHHFLRPVSRREAYQADITYGTNSEFGFDYLRDNLEYESEVLRQRDFNFAIVDEIDSILIDEARTPLIISAPAHQSENLYRIFADIASKLNQEEDYTVDEKRKAISLTDLGIEKTEKILGVENIYTEKGIKYVHHLETAVRAKALFKRDKEYVVRDGQVVIVDEFTGRLQPGRRWSDGLHQAIEAKERVDVKRESRTYASVTYQNYFKQYPKLSGMTGTAETSKEEFYKVYGLDVIPVPTNEPIKRIDHDDLIFQTEKGKFEALVRFITGIYSKGQPILIGTVSIEKNEELSALLSARGVPHQILNAKNHEQEANIIAQAGRRGAVTIATNMAGRGVDIKLGGSSATREEYEEVKSLGGLFVIGTERHEARRIDNQLRGRSGRQGDPGETQFFVSLEDSLMRIFSPDLVKRVMGTFGIPEDEPIRSRMINRSLESAQTKIEGLNFDARKHILQYDNVLNTQRTSIYSKRRSILLAKDEELENLFLETLNEGKVSGGIELLNQKKSELSGDFHNILRRILLQGIDAPWVDHLEAMEYVRSSVSLRSYGQRDPLVEYKKESLNLFKNMKSETAMIVFETLKNSGSSAESQSAQAMRRAFAMAQQAGSATSAAGQPQIPKRSEPKLGRNDKVVVEKDGERKEMKYKKAEELLNKGWKIVEVKDGE